jgi:putative membrane protein
VLASLIGLMVGSLRILWPWPDGVNGASLGSPDSQVLASLLAAIVGFVFVVAISRLARPKQIA